MQQPVTNVEWRVNSRQTIYVSMTIVTGETNRAQPTKESTFLERCANVADALFKNHQVCELHNSSSLLCFFFIDLFVESISQQEPRITSWALVCTCASTRYSGPRALASTRPFVSTE